jgi:GH24 family phage-related lysozyme (muramidase)
MNKDAIKEWIESWENRVPQVYPDSAGHPTIGVGFNLDRADAPQKIAALGLDYSDVREGRVTLNDAQIEQLFDADVDQAIADSRRIVSNFDTIPESKQKVVVDMVFNLGAAGFAGFHNTIQAIENEDWQTAAQEMQNSCWYSQVKDRGVADVDVMAEA